jgi:hypothetical protein
VCVVDEQHIGPFISPKLAQPRMAKIMRAGEDAEMHPRWLSRQPGYPARGDKVQTEAPPSPRQEQNKNIKPQRRL